MNKSDDINSRVSVNETNIITLYSQDKEINIVLDKVRNRLPVWATFLITGLSSICCSLGVCIIMSK